MPTDDPGLVLGAETREQFVTALYRTFFSRSPDADGLRSNVKALEEGVPPHTLVARFLNSPEFELQLKRRGFPFQHSEDPMSRQTGAIESRRARLVHDLIDGDPDTDKGIDSGRNIRAGYARSVGLEQGGLDAIIASDADWIAGFAAGRNRSIVSPHRLMNLFLIIKYSNIRRGNIIEFGSYRGGSALMMAMLAQRLRPDCKVYALDTFAGMPDTDPHLDRHRAGAFADSSFEELAAIKSELGLDNLVILKGLFQDTVGRIPLPDRHFFLTHVDCDIYESIKFSIRYAKRYGVPGSYVVFDDPLTADCLGAMKAVEEDLIQHGAHAEQVYPHLVFRYPPLPDALL